MFYAGNERFWPVKFAETRGWKQKTPTYNGHLKTALETMSNVLFTGGEVSCWTLYNSFNNLILFISEFIAMNLTLKVRNNMKLTTRSVLVCAMKVALAWSRSLDTT